MAARTCSTGKGSENLSSWHIDSDRYYRIHPFRHIDFFPPSPCPKRKENQSREYFSSRCSRILFRKSVFCFESARILLNQRGSLKHSQPTNLHFTICP
ncbi:hypothetical protein CEXT_411541 [Caerostris extrusa]|uniref:Uncharacterized protein n=1 Tax=Caerostris extrusa TaxID=172846 RepID=A0AAV4NVR6_CAEEX|nr:hypothetical protein CEXT_411541 [Caerostris extrusa]